MDRLLHTCGSIACKALAEALDDGLGHFLGPAAR